MRRWIPWAAGIVAMGIAAAVGYWIGRHSDSINRPTVATATSGGQDPVVPVWVTPIRWSSINEKLIAYGTVLSQPSDVRVVSVPFEARVVKLLATAGEEVKAGTLLGEVEPSPATRLAVQDARNAASAATRDLEQVRQRFNEHLATNQELSTAESNLRSAQLRLQSLEQSGATGPQQLKSEASGVVSKVDVQVGQVVPIGNPLIEIATRQRIEARIGVEPEDVPYLHTGQGVHLHMVNAPGAGPVEGRIRLIAQRVNPTTRLVDIFVSLPPGANLMLDGFVAGELTKASTQALVVPRQAVLPTEDGHVLFTVKDGHAVRHVVNVGLENDREIQVEGSGVQAGQHAVIVGNYELRDGMTVEVRAAAPGTAPSPTTEAVP